MRRDRRTLTQARASRYRDLPKTKYKAAHVLILTWAFHDLAGGFDEVAGDFIVSLEEETARLHDTFATYGYQVHERLIPMDASVERLAMIMKEFLRFADDETLLIVYYHGHGGLDEDGELVFSRYANPLPPPSFIYESPLLSDTFARRLLCSCGMLYCLEAQGASSASLHGG